MADTKVMDIQASADVQNRRLTKGFMLTRVGVTGVKKPVKVVREGTSNTLFCTIDVYVDLPSTQKGSHLSRNLEAINEEVEKSLRQGLPGIEVFAAGLCRSLRQKHEYSTYAEVRVIADYFMTRPGPSGKPNLESFKIMAQAVSRNTDVLKKMIGVEVIGMTACPCAMETVREQYGTNVTMEKDLPMISHNQRNVSSVMVEVPEDLDVEANDLIEIVEASFSSPTYEVLKRSDEAKVVLQAHLEPKFVEDVVRTILFKVLERYPDLPDETLITARSESEESIHKHNAFAERVTTLGDLRSGA
ncbi:MAG TPA: GTP cyclohydrolase MptA [Methanomassiliicoccaceae archaeon]|nr:GTP cyclohydrolase MptA [Methanomassiliicoccaceae archaeon]HOK28295.1 GTP cyclohydrolase MptA [Methanomassiliicoccaceae archaeon]HOQ25776.1 GTP cyclohydrolase MptA [Methanomassiliicoccaceae archaeon]HPT74348.1 GTP cyclohydrolase MptA [Methanomassiliicoccaceae archaeon]HQA21045.1 GTP cyclohydrolase MptA [Methanomassiliicoccaceae archaeon]